MYRNLKSSKKDQEDEKKIMRWMNNMGWKYKEKKVKQ